VKRPILAFLAAVILNLGVVGTAPARAAAPHSMTAAVPTPAHHHGHRYHHGDDDGYHDDGYYDGGHRHHPRHSDGDDDGYGDDGHHRRRCSGLIVVCLV
jgi:hypothetical protein